MKNIKSKDKNEDIWAIRKVFNRWDPIFRDKIKTLYLNNKKDILWFVSIFTILGFVIIGFTKLSFLEYIKLIASFMFACILLGFIFIFLYLLISKIAGPFIKLILKIIFYLIIIEIIIELFH
jgi:hypothetical protein